jgi:hypothetical protein
VRGFINSLGTGSTTPSWTINKPGLLGGGSLTVTAPANSYRDLISTIVKFIVVISSIYFAGTWIMGWNRGDSPGDG